MAILMTSPILTPTTTKSAIYSLYSSSSSAIPLPKNHKFLSSTLVPQLGHGPFSSWNGLRHLGISVTLRSIKIGAFFHIGVWDFVVVFFNVKCSWV